MTETGKVFLRYLYKRFGWKVIHHRKKLFRIIHKRAFETSMKKLKFVIFTNAPCKGLNSNRQIKYNYYSLFIFAILLTPIYIFYTENNEMIEDVLKQLLEIHKNVYRR